jgi:hypothetical protein
MCINGVSVVIRAYTEDRWDDVLAAVASVHTQSRKVCPRRPPGLGWPGDGATGGWAVNGHPAHTPKGIVNLSRVCRLVAIEELVR